MIRRNYFVNTTKILNLKILEILKYDLNLYPNLRHTYLFDATIIIIIIIILLIIKFIT